MEQHLHNEHDDNMKQIGELMQKMPQSDVFYAIANLLGLFGDETRVGILYELLDKELCVNDIAQRLEMSASAISHQLRILKQGRLVKSRREGKTIFYSLADSHVKTIFYHALEHVTE
ncbi:MAG TPA: transcriptional regulator [Ruminococcus sp.]|jgi:ArsR family transcriptional regulator|nr:transcriptional regulator [Ruminococcus sp.]